MVETVSCTKNPNPSSGPERMVETVLCTQIPNPSSGPERMVETVLCTKDPNPSSGPERKTETVLCTQNPNPSSGPESKAETVLCIFTYRRLLILDMEAILRRDEDQHQDGLSASSPPLLRNLDFVASGLPLGMGWSKQGNFFYMFGGEYRNYGSDSGYHIFRKGIDEPEPEQHMSPLNCFGIGCHPLVDGKGLRGNNPPSPVYRLDLTDPGSNPVKLRPLLGPKLYPIVEEIGGQLYILSRKRLPVDSKPLFEVWNPRKKKSRALPNPPSFPDCVKVLTHLVSGTNIICWMDNDNMDCFDTASETWQCVEYLSPREVLSMYVTFDVRNKDVYLTSRKRSYNLWAVMDGPEPEEGSGCPPVELMFDPSRTQPNIPGFEGFGSILLADTREQADYMCGLVQYRKKNDFGFALYIFVFQVEKLKEEVHPSQEEQLSVTYLSRRFYDFTSVACRGEEVPLFHTCETLIGRVLPRTSTGFQGRSKGKGK